MIVGLHHVAIGVPDIDQALEFYTGALGFRLLQRTRWDGDFPAADRAIGLPQTSAEMAMLGAGNAFIELWHYRHPVPRDTRSRPCDWGYPHFALQVDDLQAEYTRLQGAGMRFVGPPEDFGGSAAIYGADPFGNVIELYEIRDADIPQLARSRRH